MSRDPGAAEVVWTPRRAVRALIVDPVDDALLLMETRFPQWDRSRWLTPGGGIDAGETPEQALVREIREETGLVIGPSDITTGPVWRRRARFEFGGVHYDQRETFYVVHHPRFTPDPYANPATHETDALIGFDWWTAARMRTSDAFFVPTRIAEYFARLDRGAPPAEPPEPMDVGH